MYLNTKITKSLYDLDMMKTFIRWPGNKSKYLKHILPLVPTSFNTYIEPFVGTGAVFLAIEPKRWIINDLNRDIYNIWQNVKKQLPKILVVYESFQKKFIQLTSNDKLMLCKETVKAIPSMSYAFERAAMFMLMTHCAFLGFIFQKSKFVIYGLDHSLNTKKDIYFFSDTYKENINHVSRFLKSREGQIMNTDYRNVIALAKKDDFVFLDPPYIENHDYKFNYNQDQKKNLDFLLELSEELDVLESFQITVGTVNCSLTPSSYVDKFKDFIV